MSVDQSIKELLISNQFINNTWDLYRPNQILAYFITESFFEKNNIKSDQMLSFNLLIIDITAYCEYSFKYLLNEKDSYMSIYNFIMQLKSELYYFKESSKSAEEIIHFLSVIKKNCYLHLYSIFYMLFYHLNSIALFNEAKQLEIYIQQCHDFKVAKLSDADGVEALQNKIKSNVLYNEYTISAPFIDSENITSGFETICSFINNLRIEKQIDMKNIFDTIHDLIPYKQEEKDLYHYNGDILDENERNLRYLNNLKLVLSRILQYLRIYEIKMKEEYDFVMSSLIKKIYLKFNETIPLKNVQEMYNL